MDDGGGLEAGRFEVWSDAPIAGPSYRVQTSGLKRAMDVLVAFGHVHLSGVNRGGQAVYRLRPRAV